MVMAALTTWATPSSFAGPFADHAMHLAEMLAHLLAARSRARRTARPVSLGVPADQPVAPHRIERLGMGGECLLDLIAAAAAVCARAARRRWSAGNRRRPARSSERRCQPRLDGLRQFAADGAAEDDDVVAQPQQRAQQGTGVGSGCEAGGALMLGFGAGGVQAGEEGRDLRVDLADVRPARRRNGAPAIW